MIKRDRVTVNLRNALESLHIQLIAPLAIPTTTRRLIIIPDKVLYSVPWPALSAKSAGGLQGFMDHLGFARLNPIAATYTLNILPSALLLSELEELPISSATLIASGVGLRADTQLPGMTSSDHKIMERINELRPLTETITEMTRISDLLKLSSAQVKRWVFTGSISTQPGADRGTMEQVIASLSGRSILHIAAHGVFNPTQPMASFLLLDTADPGLLFRAADFLKADLTAIEVALLTACQSGNVMVRAGNEVMGFTRALFAAGAKRLILTSWLVDDHASLEYSTALYEKLSTRMKIADAHRAAVNHLRKHYSHPYSWAAYMMSSRD